MSEFFRIVAEYGPFPLGIIVGIWLARGAYSQSLRYSEKEKAELREEKRQLRETIEAQQKRIDLLHDEAYKPKPRIGDQ